LKSIEKKCKNESVILDISASTFIDQSAGRALKKWLNKGSKSLAAPSGKNSIYLLSVLTNSSRKSDQNVDQIGDSERQNLLYCSRSFEQMVI